MDGKITKLDQTAYGKYDENKLKIKFNNISIKEHYDEGWIKAEFFSDNKFPENTLPSKIFYNKNGIKDFEVYVLTEKNNVSKKEIVIAYYKNGNIKNKSYFTDKTLNNDNNFAVITYYENGNLESEMYFANNKPHREQGPAKILYENNHKKKIITSLYYKNGLKINRGRFILENSIAICKKRIFKR